MLLLCHSMFIYSSPRHFSHFFYTMSTFLSVGNFVSSMVFLWSYSLQRDQAENVAVRLLIHLPSPAQGSFA